MRFNELKESADYDFHWDEGRFGYYVVANGEERGFFKAKSMFDRSEAQDAAKKLMFKIRSDDVVARQKADQYQYQYVKPLSDIEKEWVELEKRYMSLNDEELARWLRLGKSGVVRKSMIDKTHPALKAG